MKITLEHAEIVRACELYIRETYGDKAVSSITVTKIENKNYVGPPSFALEADVTVPSSVAEG